MNHRILFSMLGAGVILLASSAPNAQAFGLFGNKGCGCATVEASCGCATAPVVESCGCNTGCCDATPCCGRKHRVRDFFAKLRSKRCCAPACGCDAAPSCGCDAAPSCGCATAPAAPSCGCATAPAAPSCGCDAAPSCCDAAPACGCRKPRCRKHRLRDFFAKLRSKRCCAPACGCDAAPSCGCATVAAPSCGCNG